MKTLFALLFASFGLSAAAHELNDTIVKVNRPDSVLVTRNDSAIMLRIHGAYDDPSAKYTYTFPTQGTTMVDAAAKRWKFPDAPFKIQSKGLNKKNSYSITSGSLLVGFNIPKNAPNAINSDLWGRNIDIETNFLRFSITRNHHHRFSLGWSYGWTKISLDGGLCFHLDNGVTSIGPYAEGQTPIRSVFRLNRHSFPLLYTRQDKGVNYTFGTVINLNVRPRIYNTYLDSNGQEVQDTYKKGIHFTPATVSFYGEIKVRWFGIFARYTPQSMFEKGFGPKFQTLTVGLSFF